jgi:hypothetical protein
MNIKNKKDLDKIINVELQKTAIQLFNQNHFCITQSVVDAMHFCNKKENQHHPFCACFLGKKH